MKIVTKTAWKDVPALYATDGNNPEKYTLRKTGKYVRSGTPARYGGLSIGDAKFHYDPSF